MARTALRLTAQELAEKSGVSWATIQRMEATDGTPAALTKNLEAVQKALEALGVAFTNDDEPGVKLRKRDLPVRNKPPT